MNDLKLLYPVRGQDPLRFGETLRLLVDVTLDAPWIELPSQWRRLAQARDLDGEPGPAIAFESRSPQSVRALATGRSEVRDSGQDDHSGPPLRQGRGSRGVEAVVTTGGLTIAYSHLKRGSARMGLVKVGDTVGTTGNTGRCVDGARSAYMTLSGRFRGADVRLEEYTEPLVIAWTWNGETLSSPTRLPAGEVELKSFALERVVLDAERYPAMRTGENQLALSLRRGSRTLARAEEVVIAEW